MHNITAPEEFRAALRDWLEGNCPDDMRDDATDDASICWGGRNWTFASQAQETWLTRCAEQGFTVPTWPRNCGGAGLDRAREKVFQEEMRRLNACPPLQSLGIWMLGPALLHFGPEAQKHEYLSPIARGEIRWCQGRSKPGAGSDLASVQSRCKDKGAHWLVNGQKIWTSYADKADRIFALLRPHLGISFVLIDMTTLGVLLEGAGNTPKRGPGHSHRFMTPRGSRNFRMRSSRPENSRSVPRRHRGKRLAEIYNYQKE